MTYRNKLLLKRFLIVLAVIAAVILALLLIGFTYLGRYVVYTEDGAYFSFHSQAPSEAPQAQTVAAPSSIELVTGEPISANEAIGGDFGKMLEDTQVKGVLVDYDTLKNGSTLNKIELGAEANNTLVLEMRTGSSDILKTQPVLELIGRAKTQETWLVAMISCLSDSAYAEAHYDQAIKVYGGTLWADDDGRYWLDPAQDAVISYLAGMIEQLSQMGFKEVILNDFSLPISDRIDYTFGDSTSDEIMIRAYNNLLDATMDYCKLSLLITDPVSGHQAFDAADRIYVYYQDGGSVKDYVEAHPDQYLVFITDSHDTRFDAYGKIETDRELDVDSIVTAGGESGDTPDADDEEPDE